MDHGKAIIVCPIDRPLPKLDLVLLDLVLFSHQNFRISLYLLLLLLDLSRCDFLDLSFVIQLDLRYFGFWGASLLGVGTCRLYMTCVATIITSLGGECG